MLQDELFRWALVFQEKAGTNVQKYICQYARAVLFSKTANDMESLSTQQLSEYIKNDYEISFHIEEVKSSVGIYGKKMGIHSRDNNRYYLDSDERLILDHKLKSRESTEMYVKRFTDYSSEKFDIALITHLINRFIYFVFEKNKNYFVSINDENKVIYSGDANDFPSTTEEKRIINTFLQWDDYAKNLYLYRVITTSFNYGILTLKKKSQANIFKGKTFILDTNIIIPLAGIGNPSRVSSIRSFYEKCKQNNISLVITDETFDEAISLVSKKSQLLKIYTKNGRPIERTNLEVFNMGSLEDFYDYYYIWSQKKDYRDISLLESDLKQLLIQEISKLNSINIKKKMYQKKPEYTEFLHQLKEYKLDASKFPTDFSLHVDIVNFLYATDLRNDENFKNIFDTNLFIISLDNNYRKWSEQNSSFIPIVMHPLDWLTILYKFTGRTDNDYEAFSKFLLLNDETPLINFDELVDTINEFTSDDSIKSKVVQQIVKDVKSRGYTPVIDIKAETSRIFDELVKDLKIKHAVEIEKKNRKMDDEKRAIKKEVYENNVLRRTNEYTHKKMIKWEWFLNHEKHIKIVASSFVGFLIFILVVRNKTIIELLGSLTQNSIATNLINIFVVGFAAFAGALLVWFFKLVFIRDVTRKREKIYHKGLLKSKLLYKGDIEE